MGFEFTEQTEATFAAAVQLAKDYAHSQVQPLHFAYVILKEDIYLDSPGFGPEPVVSGSLFAQAIQKAGGDQVSAITAISPYVPILSLELL
jgi:ATP-dependent Clp protease ATP-binding subunit ClpB